MFPRLEALPHQACSHCLTILRPSRSSLSRFLNQCLLMLALWSCGRRAASSKRSGKSTGLFVPAFTIAELVVRTMAEQPALVVPRHNARIGRHGTEYHSPRCFSSPILQATLQCPQLPVRVNAWAL